MRLPDKQGTMKRLPGHHGWKNQTYAFDPWLHGCCTPPPPLAQRFARCRLMTLVIKKYMPQIITLRRLDDQEI